MQLNRSRAGDPRKTNFAASWHRLTAWLNIKCLHSHYTEQLIRKKMDFAASWLITIDLVSNNTAKLALVGPSLQCLDTVQLTRVRSPVYTVQEQRKQCK